MAARTESPHSDQRAALFCWRRLRKEELDHELIWSCTSAGTVLLGFVWLKTGRPLPPCAFHAVTGWPCPTCGTTRATLKLLQGELAAAFALNPLYFMGLAAVAAFNVYAVVVLAGGLPRLRLGALPPGKGQLLRWGAIALILANWAWLVYWGV